MALAASGEDGQAAEGSGRQPEGAESGRRKAVATVAHLKVGHQSRPGEMEGQANPACADVALPTDDTARAS